MQGNRVACAYVPDVSHGYCPAGAVFSSSIIHELVIVVLLLLSFSLSRTHIPASRSFNDTIKLRHAKGVIYCRCWAVGAKAAAALEARLGFPARVVSNAVAQ